LARLGAFFASKITLLSVVGGPGNNVDRHYHYVVEKDVNFNAKEKRIQIWILSTYFI
jgi:hypothetical protein